MTKSEITRYFMLGFLTLKPMTGYELKKTVDQTLGYYYGISNSHIYPGLKKLEEEGFVTHVLEIIEERSKARRRYTLTESGREELAKWLAEPCKETKPQLDEYEFTVKLFFPPLLSKENAIMHITQSIAGWKAFLKICEDASPLKELGIDYNSSLVRSWAINRARYQLKWSNEMLEKLMKT